MQSEETIKALLTKYISGQCSTEEIIRLKQWFERVQRNSTTQPALTTADEERLVQQLLAHKRMQLAQPTAPNVRPLFPRIARLAAAALAGLLLVSGWMWQQQHTQPKIAIATISAPQTPAPVTLKTTNKQVSRFELPDGSLVWVNANSSVVYNADFIRHREVQLTGEAFFDVVHDPSRPFVVRAGKAATKVYGTAFNIAAYPAADQLRVSLKRGSIGVTYDSAANTAEHVLAPGQLLIYNKSNGIGRLDHQPTTEIGSWTSGKLVFYKAPMHEVLFQLETRYGLHVVYDHHARKNDTITAKFEDVPLKKVLAHLSFGWDLRFNQKSDTLYVK